MSMDLAATRPAPASLRWVVTATSFGFALIQLDVTIVNVALPRIGHDLNTSVAGLQWVVDAYALVFSTLLLTAGLLSDRTGARRLYLGSLGLFGLASLVCGLATTPTSLVIGRAVQGVAAAGILPASLSLLNHASSHDARLRAWAIGWWHAAGAITIAAGPIVGGLILGVASWRMIFLVNLPLCLIGMALTARMDEPPRPQATRGFDPLGQLTAMLALGSFVAAVIGAKPFGLTHPLVLGGFAVAALSSVAFVAAEARGRSPMLPLALFARRSFAACVAYGMICNLTYYGIVFVISLYLQRGLGYGAVTAGLAYLPLTATFFGVNVASGMLTARFGSRLPMVFGALVDAAGFALLLPLGLESSYAAMVLPFILMPAGMGTGIPAMTITVLASTEKHMAGVAAAALNAARQAGGAIGVALFGALAGDGRASVAGGLHASALTAVILLVAAAGLAAVAVPRRAG